MFRGRQLAQSGAAAAPGLIPLPTTMVLEFAQISDLGRVREGNEDCLGASVPDKPERTRSHGWLFALADGVGGHDCGEVASQKAIATLVEGFAQAVPGESHGSLLTRLVQTANTGIVDAGHAAHISMATTVVACALRFDRATVAHVGDSRCYLIRKGQAIQLTRDHTLANEQFRLGVISAAEAGDVATRHILSRSVGTDLVVKVDVSEQQVFAGDVILLCSDGLHGSVSGSEMAALLGPAADLKAAAQRLVDVANQRDGSDNISAQIVRIQSVERVGMYRGRPYRLP